MSQTPDQQALHAAWARLFTYDTESSQQKELYKKTRITVISLWFIASLLAVLLALSNYGFARDIPFLGYIQFGLRVGLGGVLIASALWMTWGLQFANSNAWIEYRTSAERIRSHIYLFRTSSGPYARQEQAIDRRKILLDALVASDRRIPEGIGLPAAFVLPDDPRVFKELSQKPNRGSATVPDDQFITPLRVEDYIEQRLKPQIKWYKDKVTQDIENAKRQQIIVLILAGVGSLLAVIGLGAEALVAVTTALGTAVAMKSNIEMYGRTYSIYRQTANDLQNELDRWNALESEQQKESGKAETFVFTVEKILLRENREWRKQSIQMQNASEQSLLKNLQTSGVKLPFIKGTIADESSHTQRTNSDSKVSSTNQPDPATGGPVEVEPASNPILSSTDDVVQSPAMNGAESDESDMVEETDTTNNAQSSAAHRRQP